MIPQGLSDQHIKQAADKIDQDGIPPSRNAVHYDLLINDKKYPLKYIISLANYFAYGEEYPSSYFNAVEAKNYFLSRGYDVIDRRLEAEDIITEEDDESAFPEGKEKYSQHRRLERDTAISLKAKAKTLAETGSLQCEVCSIDFSKTYGDIGLGFIEAHHKKPVSTLNGTEKTKISDLALVCSNCHRMLHRCSPPLSVEELKTIFNG